MSESPNRQATMQSRRIDLEREISIRVPAFDSFITEYSSNISTTGMFIRSDKPLPPDTQLGFEFKVADDWKLIRGTATVIWSRYRDEGAERPPGMGVLFTEIDPQSRRLIHWIIEKYVREGGTPFDIGALKATYNEELVEMAETEKDVGMPPPVTRVMERPKLFVDKPSPPPRSEPVKFRLLPLIGAGVVVAAVLFGLFWISEQGAQSAANPDLDVAASEADATAGDAGAATSVEGAGDTAELAPDGVPTGTPAAPETRNEVASAPAEPATQAPAPADPVAAAPAAGGGITAAESAVRQAFDEAAQRVVRQWAEAWSNQDVESYLEHYSRDFRPSGGGSRAEWAASRADRLTRPQFIRISVSAMEAEIDDGARGRASFVQKYESDRFQDSVRKTLELVREEGRWRILEERSSPSG